MPYTIIENATDCNGFAVVKENETTPVPGGCHQTMSEAQAHLVALEIATAGEYSAPLERSDMETETRDGEGFYPLTPRQLAQYSADESIVELFGKYDQGNGPDGAHYSAESPFADEGMVCSSCTFFEGGNACEIVDGEIMPSGICKRWIIAGDLIGTPVDLPVPTETEPAMIDEPMIDESMVEPAPVRYSAIEIENRRIGGRDVEFRSVEVGGLELRATDGSVDAPMQFTGYAAVFNSPSEPLPFIETIAPGAFRRSLNSGREVRLFINHDMGQPLATTRNGSMRLSEDQRGLKVEATLPDTTAARDLATLIDTGVVHSMSFGFSSPTGGDAWSEDGNSRELRDLILHEASIVTGFPAYPATAGAQVRSTEEISDDDNSTGMPVALARRIIELTAKR